MVAVQAYQFLGHVVFLNVNSKNVNMLSPSVLRKKAPESHPTPVKFSLSLCSGAKSHASQRKAQLSSASPLGKVFVLKALKSFLFLEQNLESPLSMDGHAFHLGEAPSSSDIHRMSVTNQELSKISGFQGLIAM